jgi:hypothetical protein
MEAARKRRRPAGRRDENSATVAAPLAIAGIDAVMHDQLRNRRFAENDCGVSIAAER